MKKALSYQDIYLVPAYSELHTRSDADLSVQFLGRTLAAPWLPANMSSVVNPDICKWLSETNYPYIMHRFGDTQAFITRANEEDWKLISVSVGVKDVDCQLLQWIVREGKRVDWITIDVAHAHSVLVKDIVKIIKDTFTDYHPMDFAQQPKIIAGNVATPEAILALTDWGADAIKVGVGSGTACSTKTQTSFHIPMFTCVKDCHQWGSVYTSPSVPLISDGGIRENGDIPKALRAGATLVMMGGLLAACTDAPGENLYLDSRQMRSSDNRLPTHKRYHGSASEHQKGERKHVEGLQLQIPCNGLTYAEKYQELTESLSSAVSYAGGVNLKACHQVKYVRV